ncbi:beta galactosidase jelly roll domain-containing protein [Flagellimonas sp. HMM57]|uniref:glycoside hydrolase family 2 protein n=1 Tax=unclassified Flagellimonas TaxID=2644544 RepID=UPI0013D57C58|nr:MULTISPECIES: glycoside hydrolase family 2 TIM barrel-domain containing protein [unclassified Flagellimonas]UII76516.1 beta galactosidase jelly roll domain-containing protein [Flagellimonas sp. HMM57]
MKNRISTTLNISLCKLGALSFLLSFAFIQIDAQEPLLQNVYNRPSTSLNGNWKYVIDPYDTGYRNHRNWTPFDEAESTKASAKPYYTDKVIEERWDRVEYDFNTSPEIIVPSDWNSQFEKLQYYEGAIWYRTTFDYTVDTNQLTFLYFGAANYQTDVYLNGEKVGQHLGGFDPFNFDITNKLKTKGNSLVVRVDNRREKHRVPNYTTDWWNYGGITREVKLVSVPKTHIQDYSLQLDKDNPNQIKGYVQVSNATSGQSVTIQIPEAKINKTFITDTDGRAQITILAKKLKKWYPKRPKLYEVSLSSGSDTLKDQIGFRTITTEGANILLNGKSIFLRGISLHEENPIKIGRAKSMEDAKMLFGWAKELNCNFVRLAHYPHNENMPRLADKLGLLLWEEIPVYWGIDYENPTAFAQAKSQLETLVHRDKNRASVIVWSVANETPDLESRLIFLRKLKDIALAIDDTRFISAALERDEKSTANTVKIPDPFAEDVDILSCNEYIGWYSGLPSRCGEVTWDLPESKPFFVSEFGGGALYNHHGDKLTRWTEEYQEYLYEEQLNMLQKISTLRGMTPWILVDFRSPRRNLPLIQDGWNRKGLISENGFKKKAFHTLKAFYDEMEKKYDYKIND